MRRVTILKISLSLVALAGLAPFTPAQPGQADESAVQKAVTFYASFDETLKPDRGMGTLSTRSNQPQETGKFVFAPGYNAEVFRIARGKGIAGGCLEVTEVLPNNGRIFFPARGNLAFHKGGWGGSLSVWINTDPNTLFKTKFCDPIQITQKGANNGGIWFDFNDAAPRDLRMGVFPAVADGTTPIKEDSTHAPMVRVPKIRFKSGAWHHVVMTWSNLDTGRKDALAVLYIDGEKKGDVRDQALAMDWDLDQTGIYIAVNFIGLLDEMALYHRPLTAAEVTLLHQNPALLTPLRKRP